MGGVTKKKKTQPTLVLFLSYHFLSLSRCYPKTSPASPPPRQQFKYKVSATTVHLSRAITASFPPTDGAMLLPLPHRSINALVVAEKGGDGVLLHARVAKLFIRENRFGSQMCLNGLLLFLTQFSTV